MASLKLTVILLWTFAVVSQVQPHVVSAASRTLGEVTENLDKILDIIISAVQQVLSEIDPIFDAIQAKINTELGKFLQEIRDYLKNVLLIVIYRIQYLKGKIIGILDIIRSTMKPSLDAAVTIEPVLENAEANLVLLAKQVFDIIRSGVQQGINDANPLLDAIQAEINADLGEFIQEIRDDLKNVVANVVTRLTFLEGEVADALATIRGNIQPCLDAAVTTIDPVLDSAEAKLAVLARQVQADNREALDDLYANIDALTSNLDVIIDTAISASLKCVVPGSADVKKCLDTSTTALANGLQETLVNLALILTEAIDVVTIVVGDAVTGAGPIINATIDDLQGPLTTFGDCVTSTKLY